MDSFYKVSIFFLKLNFKSKTKVCLFWHLKSYDIFKVLTDAQHELALKNEYNFDHPNAFDFELIIETLRELKHGKCVNVPIYNFATHSREKQVKTVYGANVIIFEGMFVCFCVFVFVHQLRKYLILCFIRSLLFHDFNEIRVLAKK